MSTHEKLVALANAKNKSNVPADCVRIQNLRPHHEVTADGTVLDTAVDVVGILEKGYSNTTPLYYRRIDISRLFAGVTPSITVKFAEVNTHSVVAELNKLYPALELDPGEFVLGSAVAGSPMFTLVSGSESLMYIGSVVVAINYILDDISLDLTNTKLSGFTYQN